MSGMTANGLGLVLTIALARLLDERAYGAYASLLGLSLILSMPGSALVVAVVRKVYDLRAACLGADVGPWSRQVRRRLTVVAAVSPLCGAVVAAPVSRLLSIPSVLGVALIVAACGVWALLGFERGLLQADGSYPSLGRNLLVEAAVRTVVTVGLVGAGAGVGGAAGGVIAAHLTAASHARRSVARGAAAEVVEGPPVVGAAGSPELGRDAAAALVVLALLAVLQTLDVLVVGREAPGRSGSYAAISVTSKGLLFIGFALTQYLLPEAARRFSSGQGALRQLGVSLALLAVPAGGLLVISLAVPELLLRTVFGPELVGAAAALPTLVLAMAALSAAVLLSYYLLAARRREVVVLLAVAVLTVLVALRWADGRPVATARALLACNAALAGILCAVAVRASRRADRRADVTAPGG